ncbi:MAG: FtsX-like permease family protein [Alphaproteobacteria bacterium]|nr:FtsX-like permease family protein [Alphaproteobacteria bacterium]
MTPLNKKLYRDLWHIRGQALAIAVVIAGGIATLVMALSALDSLQETRRAFSEQYRFAHVFAHAKRAPDWVAREIGAIPGVLRAEGRIVQDIIIDIAEMQEPARGRVVSRAAGGQTHLNDIVIRRGRDLRHGYPNEVLVNEAFAQAHGLQLGDVIHGNFNQRRRALKVVGVALSPEFVYAIGPGDIVPDGRHFGILWMSREALEAAYDLKGAFNNLTLRLTRAASLAEVIVQVDRLLAPYGGVGAYGRADQLSDAFVTSEMEQLDHLAVVIPPVFLLIAAFLFNVVIARIIQADREQIGLLKAFGYSNIAVGWQYLKLVLLITGLGILIGWAMGAWMGYAVTGLYRDFFRFPFLYFQVDPSTLAISAFVGIFSAVIGALSAVRRAVTIAPAVAMTPPMPSAYRTSLLENLGLARFLSQPARMILRYLFRWPLRATLTITGIAFSVAILVMSLFFFDAVNKMMDIHFFETERQDMTLTFVDVRTDAARSNIDDLPGVLMVETFRIARAKLRLGHRQERVGIIGIDGDMELSRLVDVDGRVVTPPPEGIVLSEKLAELLVARKGDILTVSTLEGRRLVRQVPVVRIVRLYIGLGAYMDRRALNRLMGEGDIISGAHVLTDSKIEPTLYTSLKGVPALLGLAVRRAALNVFSAMIREHLHTMIFFYLTFAALIAVGVIYNSARISLSERARELASLRVLGFTRREVGTILAGELAILTFVALPLGCIAGYGLAGLLVNLFDTKLYRLPLYIADSSYGYAVLMVIGATIGSAWLVLRRVAQLDLIAVMKTRE